MMLNTNLQLKLPSISFGAATGRGGQNYTYCDSTNVSFAGILALVVWTVYMVYDTE